MSSSVLDARFEDSDGYLDTHEDKSESIIGSNDLEEEDFRLEGIKHVDHKSSSRFHNFSSVLSISEPDFVDKSASKICEEVGIMSDDQYSYESYYEEDENQHFIRNDERVSTIEIKPHDEDLKKEDVKASENSMANDFISGLESYMKSDDFISIDKSVAQSQQLGFSEDFISNSMSESNQVQSGTVISMSDDFVSLTGSSSLKQKRTTLETIPEVESVSVSLHIQPIDEPMVETSILDEIDLLEDSDEEKVSTLESLVQDPDIDDIEHEISEISASYVEYNEGVKEKNTSKKTNHITGAQNDRIDLGSGIRPLVASAYSLFDAVNSEDEEAIEFNDSSHHSSEFIMEDNKTDLPTSEIKLEDDFISQSTVTQIDSKKEDTDIPVPQIPEKLSNRRNSVLETIDEVFSSPIPKRRPTPSLKKVDSDSLNIVNSSSDTQDKQNRETQTPTRSPPIPFLSVTKRSMTPSRVLSTTLSGISMKPSVDQNFVNVLNTSRQQLQRLKDTLSSARQTRAIRQSRMEHYSYTKNPFT